MTNQIHLSGPIAIGGVGGSGTRIVAELLKQLGIFIGDNLNRSNDNQSFPRLREFTFHSDLPDEEQRKIVLSELRRFETEMLDSLDQSGQDVRGWGWKAPPMFLWLDLVSEHFPNLKYIHVIRHGLDMAYSPNQNQVRELGYHAFGIRANRLSLRKASLRYWIQANQLAIERGKELLGKRFLLLYFDALCTNPLEGIDALIDFIGLDAGTVDREQLSRIVIPPASLGRYKTHNLRIFDRADLDEVRKLGFRIDTPTSNPRVSENLLTLVQTGLDKIKSVLNGRA
jgi:hypothetical protein